MLDRISNRGASEAERRAAVRRQAIAASLSIPGTRVHVEGDAVVIEGRALLRRMTADPELRWQMTEARHER